MLEQGVKSVVNQSQLHPRVLPLPCAATARAAAEPYVSMRWGIVSPAVRPG